MTEQFAHICGSIELFNKDLVARHDGGANYHASIVGKNLYSSGFHSIELQIDKMDNNDWIFFGIISAERIDPFNERLFMAPSSYGWAQNKKQIYFNGEGNNDGINGYDGDIKQFDRIELNFNCDTNKLILINKRTNKQYEIDIERDKCPLPWRFQVNLYYPGDQIRILSSS